MSALQVKLDEEEHKNLKLQQHIDKLEHHSIQTREVRPKSRASEDVWNRSSKEECYKKNRTLQSLCQGSFGLYSLLCYFTHCSDNDTHRLGWILAHLVDSADRALALGLEQGRVDGPGACSGPASLLVFLTVVRGNGRLSSVRHLKLDFKNRNKVMIWRVS